MKNLTTAQVNHLRRLLGWIRCDIGQSPEEMRVTYEHIYQKLKMVPDDEAAKRIRDDYERAQRLPKYVRAAIKSLEPIVYEKRGTAVDSVVVKHKYLP